MRGRIPSQLSRCHSPVGWTSHSRRQDMAQDKLRRQCGSPQKLWHVGAPVQRMASRIAALPDPKTPTRRQMYHSGRSAQYQISPRARRVAVSHYCVRLSNYSLLSILTDIHKKAVSEGCHTKGGQAWELAEALRAHRARCGPSGEEWYNGGVSTCRHVDTARSRASATMTRDWRTWP